MAYDTHNSNSGLRTPPYYWFLRQPHFPTVVNNSSLESLATNKIVATVRSQEEEVPTKIRRDGSALAPAGPEPEYTALERRLVCHLNNSVRADAQRSRDMNASGTAYYNTLQYIKLLQTRFEVDPEKIERLVLAVMRAFIAKADYAHFFAPVDGIPAVPNDDGLWKRAFAEARPRSF